MGIYVVLHGNVSLSVSLPKGYKKIYTGASNTNYQNIKDGITFYDNDLDNGNISYLNDYFSELSALYWVWKNDNDEIKGIVHHRRFFIRFFPVPHLMKVKEFRKVLEDYDIIVCQRKKVNPNVGKQFEVSVSRENIEKLEKCLQMYYPEYMESYTYVMKSNSFSPFNMMVANRSIFDSYCIWLFDVLFKLMKEIDLEELEPAKQRIFGYIGERLLPVYIHNHALRYKEVTKYNTDSLSLICNKLKTKGNEIFHFNSQE